MPMLNLRLITRKTCLFLIKPTNFNILYLLKINTRSRELDKTGRTVPGRERFPTNAHLKAKSRFKDLILTNIFSCPSGFGKEGTT